MTELHLVEHAFVLPRGEDASAGEVREVHLPLSAILVAQPNSIARERPNFNWSNHTNSLPHSSGRVQSFANGHAQRPECEQREHPVRCSAKFDAGLENGATSSFDDLIRPAYQRGRHREAESAGGLQVHHELKPGWLLDG